MEWSKKQSATKTVRRLKHVTQEEHITFEKRLRELGLFNLEKIVVKRDLITVFHGLKGEVIEKAEILP